MAEAAPPATTLAPQLPEDQSVPGRAVAGDPVPGPPPASEEAAAGALVHLPPEGALLAPSLCACCLEPGGESHRVEATGGPTLLIQYCPACHEHASAARTRWLAVSFASLLLGLATAASVVLAFGALEPWQQSLVAGGAALLPALALLGRGPRHPHTARGPAAWWRPQGSHGWSLVATHAGWARHVAEASGARWELLEKRAVRWPWPVLALATLVALGVPAARGLLGVDLRVLNHHEVSAVLIVDGRHSGEVHPSSAESPAAGLQLRLVAGRRHLQLMGKDGRVLADTTGSLQPGVDHLLAVSPEPVCFWIERTSYGRASTDRPTREPLLGPGPLWRLPGVVDSWFAPNPPSSDADSRSSGGLLLALRQGRCASEPAQALADPNP
ncbi:MAG: hypothetical protein GX607_17470 [Myxococcales bacterium]|nr:hypothetical protein [Myxococcales bacterium]